MVDLDDSEDSSEENEDKIMPPPKPAACAKVKKNISILLLWVSILNIFVTTQKLLREILHLDFRTYLKVIRFSIF